jgi:uncharacterized protein YndB with AHSA1/START domain
MSVDILEEIRKTVVVSAPVEKAWEMFAERTSSWWPLATHSIGGDETVEAVIEPERIYERLQDGAEHTWGRMLVWEPPQRMVFTWEIDPKCHGEVEVTFTTEGDSTVVQLEHRGWARFGAYGEKARERYDSGWDFVLGKYRAAV